MWYANTTLCTCQKSTEKGTDAMTTNTVKTNSKRRCLMPVINSVTVDYNGRTDLFNTFIESLLICFLNESGAENYDAAAETELAISA